MKTKASSGVAITDPRIMDYTATGQYIEGAMAGNIGWYSFRIALQVK